MSHIKSNKISFSLKDQFRKLQILFSENPEFTDRRFLSDVDISNYVRQYFFKLNKHSKNIVFGIAISKDDKKSALIQLSIKKRILADGNFLEKLTQEKSINCNNEKVVSFFFDTKILSYNDLRKILNEMIIQPNKFLALKVLNNKKYFNFDLNVLSLSDEDFKKLVLERNSSLMKEMSEVILKMKENLLGLLLVSNVDDEIKIVEKVLLHLKKIDVQNSKGEISSIIHYKEFVKVVEILRENNLIEKLGFEYNQDLSYLMVYFKNQFILSGLKV